MYILGLLLQNSIKLLDVKNLHFDRVQNQIIKIIVSILFLFIFVHILKCN